jgi:hypothetical protein
MFDYKETNSSIRYILYIVTVLIVYFVGTTFLLSSPNKIIHNYEWFHQAHKAHAANVQSVIIIASQFAVEKDKDERYRLRTELNGVKMNCLDLVGRYNSRASQIHVEWTRGASLPKYLSPSDCE